MEVVTKRLVLRPSRLSDARDLFAFLGDRAAMRFTTGDADLRETRRRIASHERPRRRLGYGPWAVALKQGGPVIGWGGLLEDPFEPGWGVELAYYFHPSVWGRGLAQELGRAAVHVADGELGLDRVAAFAHPENAASIAVLTRLGFQEEGWSEALGRLIFARTRPLSPGSGR